MADRFPAVIRIGGTLTKEQAQGLITAIRTTGFCADWGDSYFEPETIKDIVDIVEPDGILELMDDQACYGVFPDLETFLTANQIPFDRHSDAKYEYDGEVVSYRPETGTVRHNATQDGDCTVPYKDVRNALNALEEENIVKAKYILDNLLGPVIPELPPFQIK